MHAHRGAVVAFFAGPMSAAVVLRVSANMVLVSKLYSSYTCAASLDTEYQHRPTVGPQIILLAHQILLSGSLAAALPVGTQA